MNSQRFCLFLHGAARAGAAALVLGPSALFIAMGGCSPEGGGPAGSASGVSSAQAPGSAAQSVIPSAPGASADASVDASADASEAGADSDGLPGTSEGCEDDMVLVAGG